MRSMVEGEEARWSSLTSPSVAIGATSPWRGRIRNRDRHQPPHTSAFRRISSLYQSALSLGVRCWVAKST